MDALEEAGIPCFGPRKNAAIIEGSKVFSKNLMEKYHIPTAACRIFDAPGEALAYVDECPLPAVVKADGLALGKGVEVHGVGPGKGQDAGDVGGRNAGALRVGGDAAVAGQGEDPLRPGVLSQLLDDGVLAAAAADDQDVHSVIPFWLFISGWLSSCSL